MERTGGGPVASARPGRSTPVGLNGCERQERGVQDFLLDGSSRRGLIRNPPGTTSRLSR